MSAGTAIRVLATLVAAGACLATVAFAATRPASPGSGEGDRGRPTGPERAPRGDGADPRASGRVPSRPRIVKHPAAISTAAMARFAFLTSPPGKRFRCRLDRGRWQGCRSPVSFSGLAPGDHSFSVRAVDGHGRPGAAARFLWKLVEPKPFAIEPRLSGISSLYPGAAPVPLPVVLSNPNPVPILVTGLRVSAGGGPSGCDSTTNLISKAASLSTAAPLSLPANGSLSLPAAGVSPPTIALRDLPVNQDACQGARFSLSFAGEAHG